MATKPTKSTPKKAKRSSTRAAATTPKAAAKTAVKAPKPVVSTKEAPQMASAPSDKPTRDEVTKKELVASMVAATGMKKGDARRAMEATVTAIAQALSEGKDLSLPPLGKIKIARTKETPNGKLVVMRAKLKDPNPTLAKDPLAAAAE